MAVESYGTGKAGLDSSSSFGLALLYLSFQIVKVKNLQYLFHFPNILNIFDLKYLLKRLKILVLFILLILLIIFLNILLLIISLN